MSEREENEYRWQQREEYEGYFGVFPRLVALVGEVERQFQVVVDTVFVSEIPPQVFVRRLSARAHGGVFLRLRDGGVFFDRPKGRYVCRTGKGNTRNKHSYAQGGLLLDSFTDVLGKPRRQRDGCCDEERQKGNSGESYRIFPMLVYGIRETHHRYDERYERYGREELHVVFRIGDVKHRPKAELREEPDEQGEESVETGEPQSRVTDDRSSAKKEHERGRLNREGYAREKSGQSESLPKVFCVFSPSERGLV